MTVGVGARGGAGTVDSAGGRGARLGEGSFEDPATIPPAGAIRISALKSEGVVRVPCADDDATPRSEPSSSMGKREWVEGDLEGGRGRRPGLRRLDSGTSRSCSSMWMRLRKDSSAPENRFTLPSMASIRWVVRVVSSATLSKIFTCSSSRARRLS